MTPETHLRIVWSLRAKDDKTVRELERPWEGHPTYMHPRRNLPNPFMGNYISLIASGIMVYRWNINPNGQKVSISRGMNEPAKWPLVSMTLPVHGETTGALEVHSQIPILQSKQGGFLSVPRGAPSQPLGLEASHPTCTPREAPSLSQF